MAIGQGYMPTSQKLRSVAQRETVQLPCIIHMGAREVFLSTPQSSIVRSSKKNRNIMAAPEGLEPSTCRLEVGYSIQLS